MATLKGIIYTMPRLVRPRTVVCVAVALGLLFYGPPLFFLLHAKWEARNEPKLWIVPEPLSLTPASHADGETFSYFGYEFESPWNGLRQQRKTESVVLLTASTERSIMVFAPAKETELDFLKRTTAEKRIDVGDVLGEDTTRSSYALLSKKLFLTPADLRLFSSRKEMVANSVFLMLKKVDCQYWSGLHWFKTEWFRGFQKGDPTLDMAVNVEAFDAADRKLMLVIAAQKDARHRLSQAEVNTILASLRPASKS
jgi:hypothetical protein